MPDKVTIERAQKDAREGKSPSTQAGEFVREEIHHVREGKHGARSPQQAIAIGLSKARRAGVELAAPKGEKSEKTRKKARLDSQKGRSRSRGKVSSRRSRATRSALKREGHKAASHDSLSRQAKNTSRKRSSAARHRSAMKAVQTRGGTRRSRTAGKAARIR